MLSETEDEWDNATLGNSDWEGRLFSDKEQSRPLPGGVRGARGRMNTATSTDEFDSDTGGAQPFEESDAENGGAGGGWTRVATSRGPRPPQWRWQPPPNAMALSHRCPVVVEAEDFEDKGTVSEAPRPGGIAATARRPGSGRRLSAAAVRAAAPSPHRPAWRFPAAPSHTVAPRPGAGEVITAACLLSGGQVVVTAATPPYVASPTIRVWSRAAGSLVCTLQGVPGEPGCGSSATPGLRAPATCLAAGSGAIVAGACSGEAVMYDASTGRVVHRLLVPPGGNGGSGAVTCMAVAPGVGPHRAALGTAGGFLRIWTPGAPEGQPRLLAVSLGRTAAPGPEDAPTLTASNGNNTPNAAAAARRAAGGDARDDTALAATTPRQQPPLPVVAVAFSPDGLFVFAACAAAAGAAASTSNRVSRVFVFDLLAGECVVSQNGMEVSPAVAARVSSSSCAGSTSGSTRHGRRSRHGSGAADGSIRSHGGRADGSNCGSSVGGGSRSNSGRAPVTVVGLVSCLRGCEATLANGSTWAPRVNVTLCDAKAVVVGSGGHSSGGSGSGPKVLGSNGSFASVSSCVAGFSSPGTSSASTVLPGAANETVGLAKTPVSASGRDSGSVSDAGNVCDNYGRNGGGGGSGCAKSTGAKNDDSLSSGIFVSNGRGSVAFGTFLAGNGGELLVWDARRLVAPLLPSERRELVLLRRLCQDRRARPKAATHGRVVTAHGRHVALKKGFFAALFGCGGGTSSHSGGGGSGEAAADGGALLGVAGVGKGLGGVVARAVRLEERVFRHMVSFI